MENAKLKPVLKELPKTPKRGKIYEMYGTQYSVATMKRNLDALLLEYKNLTNMIVGRNDVPFAVWVEWIKLFGFPRNYEPDSTLEEQKTVFDYLVLVKKNSTIKS